jgi:hypothetical protein
MELGRSDRPNLFHIFGATCHFSRWNEPRLDQLLTG